MTIKQLIKEDNRKSQNGDMEAIVDYIIATIQSYKINGMTKCVVEIERSDLYAIMWNRYSMPESSFNRKIKLLIEIGALIKIKEGNGRVRYKVSKVKFR